MTVYFTRELQGTAEVNNAASKARNDVDSILLEEQYVPIDIPANNIDRAGGSFLAKVRAHFSAAQQWKLALSSLRKGDVVVIQFPARNHTALFAKYLKKLKLKGVRVLLLLHDLDLLRYRHSQVSLFTKARLFLEDVLSLKQASAVIAHNSAMRQALLETVALPEGGMVELSCFDYLCEDEVPDSGRVAYGLPIVIAGNLKSEKAGYIKGLPETMRFNLYGSNLDYENELHESTQFCGSFDADELAKKVEGSFGLVWDGGSPCTCEGPFGEYLLINNPHKMSFYLSIGMPVIVWSRSAVASFIESNNIGFAVESLADCQRLYPDADNYRVMKDNAERIAKKVRSGYYTKNAVRTALALGTTEP